MILKLFSLKDVKADVFGTPFCFAKVELAKRLVTDLAQDNKTAINRHPEDYHLYEIGELDDVTGELLPKSLVGYGSVLSLMPLKNSADNVRPIEIVR